MPQWYQEGFFANGKNTLRYLDKQPPRQQLPDGRVIIGTSLFTSPTSRMFAERDLYSTIFGTSINDEIEKRLFGAIDTKGSKAAAAFIGTDVAEWQRNFFNLFEFIDIQKIRTPKGLDWLRAQYPSLSQNDLMMEMQNIRMLHCTIWSEGIREIVSAEDSTTKFIVSDHPITIYNHGIPPGDTRCEYPNDPSIALKGSQTIFPLDQNHCLILTNLEYANDPAVSPLEKRTFARNYRQSMVRTDAFIRARRLTDADVRRINYVIKARARRYVAAATEEWLYPERHVSGGWGEAREALLPTEGLWRFGGEIYAKFDDGHVHYQDPFGRTEKQDEFFTKAIDEQQLRNRDNCGCGSGRAYKDCCKGKPSSRRATWTQRSIRERNLLLHRAIIGILGMDNGKDWKRVRQDLTDEQIVEVYSLYASLWPLETDLLQLLPKPDGIPRAVYTGMLHPETIGEFALGSSLYFGELIIQHRFTNPRSVNNEFNPIKNPASYRHEFLKAVLFFLMVMPLVEFGIVNLIPDPCDFDHHLRDQMMRMAQARSKDLKLDGADKDKALDMSKADFRRSIMSLPKENQRLMLKRADPDVTDEMVEETLQYMERERQDDPLAVLQDDVSATGEKGGQLHILRMAPNFEMAMYLAQATGAIIVTDSQFRWEEMLRAVRQPSAGHPLTLLPLTQAIRSSITLLPADVVDIIKFAGKAPFVEHAAVMQKTFTYLINRATRGGKPNFEAQLAARFKRANQLSHSALKQADVSVSQGHMIGVFPTEGFQDNTINRLLLMSSSENHLPNVPMAFYIGKNMQA